MDGVERQGEPRWALRALRRLRQLDAAPGLLGALRRVRQALPGDPGFGDPLSKAGRDPAGTVARVTDRLFDEQPRVSRELGLSALQVWQAALQRIGRGRGEVPVSLLFTDLVGFSSWALRAGDDEALRLLRLVGTALEPPITARRGLVVKRLGDGLMAVFPHPQLAFDALTEGRARLAQVDVAGYQPRLRAGLHVGTPRALGGDYLGVDVNVAARLVERAAADEVLVSQAAVDGLDGQRVELRRKRSMPWTKAKGVPEDLVIYSAVARSGDTR